MGNYLRLVSLTLKFTNNFFPSFYLSKPSNGTLSIKNKQVIIYNTEANQNCKHKYVHYSLTFIRQFTKILILLFGYYSCYAWVTSQNN